MIFANDGSIAGVQVAIDVTPPEEMTPPWEEQPNGHYTMTIYFDDPTSICDSTKKIQPMSTLGDRLAVRWGNTGQVQEYPLQQSGVEAPWVLGRCFVSMGTHYWFNISADMDCNYFLPLGIMYTSGDLVTFLVNIGQNQTSERWEHPSASALGFFFEPSTQPTCLTAPGTTLSTMHFFMYNPVGNTCLTGGVEHDMDKMARPRSRLGVARFN
jgi:charged multivesicular body protein 7